MIRPFTCICMLMAAGSGLYLYQTKHRAQMLDRTIAQTYKQIEQTKDRIGVLKGEWALLNEPERLQDLAQQHLSLKTLAPTQFVALADLGNHLPAPLPPGTITLPAEAPVPTPAPAGPTPIAAAKPVAPAANTFAANEKTPERSSDRLAEKTPEKMPEKMPEKTGATPLSAPRATARPSSLVASALPAPRPMPPPTPMAQAASPVTSQAPAPVAHIMAPVVNVSAQEVGRPLAPGTVGEAVARANRNRGNAPVIMPASSMTPPTYVPPSYVQPSYANNQGSSLGNNPGSALGNNPGSALGNAGRMALPAPVPYGTAQVVR
jgi:hypothetical protein